MRERGTAITATSVMSVVWYDAQVVKAPPSAAELEHPLAAWLEYPISMILLSVSTTTITIRLKSSYYVEGTYNYSTILIDAIYLTMRCWKLDSGRVVKALPPTSFSALKLAADSTEPINSLQVPVGESSIKISLII